MIHALAYRMTGSLADAEDLAQEIFIRAYRQIGSFRGEARFSSWLYRLATNTCLNWRKSAERRNRLREDLAVQEAAPAPASPADSTEMSARIQEALMKLKPKQRAAVVLTLCEGMNHAEAARVLGCSETTVSWRVFMAKRRLRALLTGESRLCSTIDARCLPASGGAEGDQGSTI